MLYGAQTKLAILIPSLVNCQQVLAEKAALWHDVLKIGRTHLADALGSDANGQSPSANGYLACDRSIFGD